MTYKYIHTFTHTYSRVPNCRGGGLLSRGVGVMFQIFRKMELVEIPEIYIKWWGGGGCTIGVGSIKSEAYKKMFFAPGIFLFHPQILN